MPLVIYIFYALLLFRNDEAKMRVLRPLIRSSS